MPYNHVQTFTKIYLVNRYNLQYLSAITYFYLIMSHISTGL